MDERLYRVLELNKILERLRGLLPLGTGRSAGGGASSRMRGGGGGAGPRGDRRRRNLAACASGIPPSFPSRISAPAPQEGAGGIGAHHEGASHGGAGALRRPGGAGGPEVPRRREARCRRKVRCQFPPSHKPRLCKPKSPHAGSVPDGDGDAARPLGRSFAGAGPILRMAQRLSALPDLKEAIARSILGEDEMADGASDSLFAIRRNMRRGR